MSVRLEDIRIVHRIVGTKHVFTSPDVPELHISHADEAIAYSNIQPALDVLEQVRNRVKARETLQYRIRERSVA
ncbi:hypothetical protein [Microvirga brassicacearum]|uniref:Uncharacterized protein n=1 Tax=Microvirga brassicacearum TaxID=2580413 RepID=A0A5N3P5F3_9HYPH|nr:hypothetical protein [Microvirga brassicacearum]KAB0264956.1 hypothetical protein FEZ63_20695 [Microvirga brassicacearum]